MRFLLFLIPAIALVYFSGGNLKYLIARPLKSPWLVPTALIIQIILFSDFQFIEFLSLSIFAVFHVISYVILLGFILLNYKVKGITILGLGTLMNATVITANGGFMPSPLKPEGIVFRNIIGLSANSRLVFLSDILALPEWIPLPEAFSIGDVFIIIGMFAYLFINSKKPFPNPTDIKSP